MPCGRSVTRTDSEQVVCNRDTTFKAVAQSNRECGLPNGAPATVDRALMFVLVAWLATGLSVPLERTITELRAGIIAQALQFEVLIPAACTCRLTPNITESVRTLARQGVLEFDQKGKIVNFFSDTLTQLQTLFKEAPVDAFSYTSGCALIKEWRMKNLPPARSLKSKEPATPPTSDPVPSRTLAEIRVQTSFILSPMNQPASPLARQPTMVHIPATPVRRSMTGVTAAGSYPTPESVPRQQPSLRDQPSAQPSWQLPSPVPTPRMPGQFADDDEDQDDDAATDTDFDPFIATLTVQMGDRGISATNVARAPSSFFEPAVQTVRPSWSFIANKRLEVIEERDEHILGQAQKQQETADQLEETERALEVKSTALDVLWGKFRAIREIVWTA